MQFKSGEIAEETLVGNNLNLKLAPRILFIWIIVSVFFLLTGELLIQALIPYFTWVLNQLSDQYVSTLQIATQDGSKMIQAITTITQEIYIENIPVSPPGVQFKVASNLVHALVPLVILYCILLSWPNIELRERLVLCLIGVPVSIIIITLVVPPLLGGHIEATLLTAAESMAQRKLPTPLIMQWVIFIESGGRWLFPILGAAFCKMVTKLACIPLFTNLQR